MLKIHHIDVGFGRIVYSGKNSRKQTVYYAICQEAPDKFTVYRVCRAYEPQWEVKSKAHAKQSLVDLFELPEGSTLLEQDIRTFIINN